VRLPVCTDRDDQKFLELARDAGAAILITKDKALLKLAQDAPRPGLFRIMTARGLGQGRKRRARARIGYLSATCRTNDHPLPVLQSRLPAVGTTVFHHVRPRQRAWRRQPRPGLPRLRLRPAPARPVDEPCAPATTSIRR
jgi:hypothetical protein